MKSIIYNTRVKLIHGNVQRFYRTKMGNLEKLEYRVRISLNNKTPVKGLLDGKPWQKVPFTDVEKSNCVKDPGLADKLGRLQQELEECQKQIMAMDAKLLALANDRETLDKSRRMILHDPNFSRAPIPKSASNADLGKWQEALKTLDQDAMQDDFRKMMLLRLSAADGTSEAGVGYVATEFDMVMHREPPPREVGGGGGPTIALGDLTDADDSELGAPFLCFLLYVNER